MASPSRRLRINVDGDFYVDDSCIDCGTCRWMAPAVFDGVGDYARVHTQPRTPAQVTAALKALTACPTASIGTERQHPVKQIVAGFPDPIAGGVHHCGFHSEDSFGAASYLIVREAGNVLVDSPRFTRPLVRAIEALGGIELMFLTHQDDVADHKQFHEHFGCDRVIHNRDVRASTRKVERKLRGTAPVVLDDELTVIPVPGHTAGSACLLYRGTFLFSGDHVAYHLQDEHVYAFSGACWYDWDEQIESMKRLAEFRFEWILPGHSAPCHFDADTMAAQMRACVDWMQHQ